MLEGIIADVLVRVLGSYVDGLNRESVRFGVWRGDLELKNLRLRPDALAILFETLGLDLPVTVTAGYIGLLRLEVPWKALRSSPVRIFMNDVTVVASPVSDGDQSALELREGRLKAARLATDEAVRDARFSVRSDQPPSSDSQESAPSESRQSVDSDANSSYRVTRWGWRVTRTLIARIVDNIQVDVKNVIVQYEDASSVRDCPYTATLAMDSLKACATDRHWTAQFIENQNTPVMHKVLFMRGLVLNWEPGNQNNNLRNWILEGCIDNNAGQWSDLVRESTRHAIRPLHGELRIALTRSSAYASAVAGTDPSTRNLKNIPRVQMDLHFPDVQIALDDFQYHTLLSTIMYLSDIDRKVRPKTAKGRWLWALERILPRFKERREAALRFNATGLKAWREAREEYCKARNMVVSARRKSTAEPKAHLLIVERYEAEFSYEDIVLFRNFADQDLWNVAKAESLTQSASSRLWSLFSRAPRGNTSVGTLRSDSNSNRSTPKRSRSRDLVTEEPSSNHLLGESSNVTENGTGEELGLQRRLSSDLLGDDPFYDFENDMREVSTPNFRMGFLLGRGAIELKSGGHSAPPISVASLEFRDLRLGIETRSEAGFLLEALLGTFEVIDIPKNVKVMYPRVPWAGEDSEKHQQDENVGAMHSTEDTADVAAPSMERLAQEWLQEKQAATESIASSTRFSSGDGTYTTVLHSYPHEIDEAIADIRGEYGIENPHLPSASPRFTSLRSGSSDSLSGISDGCLSGTSLFNRDDLPSVLQTPLKYIAALRLNQEEATEGEWAKGATRMAMDLAIGGMEVLLDGPKGAFISSVMFWHPREKMPSIMQFLSRAAAPRLASLRMDIQKAILERSVPMRMDILIRGPRFVIPGSGVQSSLVLDLGTFAMETSTGPPQVVPRRLFPGKNSHENSNEHNKGPLSVRFTDYKMACIDLGLYLLESGRNSAERLIRPFSVHLLLQVLHSSAYVEAITLTYGKVNIPKVRLQGKLPCLRTSVSHQAFRHILAIVKGWGTQPGKVSNSGIEPNRVSNSVSVSAEMEAIRRAREISAIQEVAQPKKTYIKSPLVSFEMTLEFEDLQLELRDSSSRRIVTISSMGTLVKMRKRQDTTALDYRVRNFAVVDGSRGATAPFRRLAFAGVDDSPTLSIPLDESLSGSQSVEDDAFIALSYKADTVQRTQNLIVRIRSLNLVCVRESYFALANFFYLKSNRHSTTRTSKHSKASKFPTAKSHDDQISTPQTELNKTDEEEEYADPFAALGMTTSGAAKALKVRAGRGMEISKRAIAGRGHLSVSADLDGLNLTLVTAEGAIANFDVTGCKVHLNQTSSGSVHAVGELGGFGIRDLTSAFDVYSETIRYKREGSESFDKEKAQSDGWELRIPESTDGKVQLYARLRNLRIVYLQRFIIILKKYFDVLQESLKPILKLKGGLGEVFDEEVGEDFPAIETNGNRVEMNLITECIDVVMPRHSQSPYEALRFYVPRSTVKNSHIAAPGYQIGLQVQADGVDAFALYQAPAEGEGRALTEGGKDPVLRHIKPNAPVSNLTPFSKNIGISANLDLWRRRKVPEVVLNADGLPVLKDGEEEQEYDPAKWLPAIRVRVSIPNGITARLCEAEYSILYFTFTENVIERPDIEFTDLVRGLKTPVLPARRPVQPIMFSSNRMPPNYQILFESPVINSVIMSGPDPLDESCHLISSKLQDLVGSFEYGVDYRMTIEVNANMQSLTDIRPGVPSHGKILISPTYPKTKDTHHETSRGNEMTRSVTFTWDRPFGFRSNVMVVASDLRIIVEPELFRDLGALTTPGFPFLKSSAPPPLLRFNGRLMIVTIARPEVWLMANQFPGDGRSLIVRGDIIAKVQWAAVTGRKNVEVAASSVRVNLSNLGPLRGQESSDTSVLALGGGTQSDETPMLYPCDVSMKLSGSGYDPPEDSDGTPVKIPSSTLNVNAESFLVRIDVNDTPLILAVGSRLVRLEPSPLSLRPVQPGRFDQWIDKSDDEDAKLTVHFVLPHSRLMFTDETAGHYVPIMEMKVRNAVVRSNVPWLTKASFEFALELFNEEKGWWEPGVETFPLEIVASKGRSGSQAVNIRTDTIIDLNVTPVTVSGAARVSKALKSAIIDLKNRLQSESDENEAGSTKSHTTKAVEHKTALGARRPSVAAFCVRNETGRSIVMWLPHDSKRRSLHGNGGELEIDTPVEVLLGTAVGVQTSHNSNPNASRQTSLSCILSFSGYVSKTLSAAQTGTWLVTFRPDSREISSSTLSQVDPVSLTLVWSVIMRDGVPCGCIRSLLRLVNRTRTVLEVSIGEMRKSVSTGNANLMTRAGSSAYMDEGHGGMEREYHGLIKAGDTWSIPLHAIHRPIRIRPAIFHAPDNDGSADYTGFNDSFNKTRVFYSYRWSDPLSRLTTLYETGKELLALSRNMKGTAKKFDNKNNTALILTCLSDGNSNGFSMTLLPKIDPNPGRVHALDNNLPGWVDVDICAPLVLENLLPRPLFFRLAQSPSTRTSRKSPIVAEGYIEPLRESHIHMVGIDLSDVALAVGVDNSSVSENTATQPMFSLPPKQVGDFMPNLPTVHNIPMGSGKYTPFTLKLDHEKSISSTRVKTYCEYWIRNRSDTDLFFRDCNDSRDPKKISGPKVYLRARPPGQRADRFVCFSGKWLSFQRADVTEDVWISVGTEVSEIDKPVRLRSDGLSLLLDVRPARGRLQKALVVTIRNSVWMENRTGTVMQWCQPAALNSQGIALKSRVHTVPDNQRVPLHWDFFHRKKAVCLRLAAEDNSSDWIWSRPVSVEGVEGEYVAKMYRPKKHKQYIARVSISKLGNGVVGVSIHKEDRNTPPYRIVNQCAYRSIAFRQSNVNETHPWLVRPGKTSRYSWDDPQAPVKKRSLVVEVIEQSQEPHVMTAPSTTTISTNSSIADTDEERNPLNDAPRGKEARYPKFELNIDMIRNNIPFSNASKFEPRLKISVHVDGPTKVVTFSDSSGNGDDGTNLDGMATDVLNGINPGDTRSTRNLDVELFVNSIGISFVEATPTELAYLSVTGIHFRLDRFDGQQMITCDVQDLQLDNQLVRYSWPVVLWSPPPTESGSSSARPADGRRAIPKPFFQFTIDGPHPTVRQSIGTFRGIFMALQQLEIAADEDFVLRVWLFVQSLIDAAGGANEDKNESLHGSDGLDTGLFITSPEDTIQNEVISGQRTGKGLKHVYVEHMELCPLKLSVSFTSSRTSTAADHIGGFRSLIRTLVAVLGNVENAEFRFNALELEHVFDTASHFTSLITEFYVSQGSNQKMVLLASNSLIGNPSALFDSIAIGTRDFFVEPAKAKGSADFIASIGRGSSSLLTHTVGGIMGSIGAIPRAVAQGLETAVGDRDYLAERDSIRGGRARIASSPAQGLMTGALSFGHGIASGAAGLIRDPLQGAAEEGASGFIKGLGKGFIGSVLKPITGALDLIAEPAAGLRSMMVSDRNRECAESARPPRAFWGAKKDQMVSYNLKASLGQAILEVVNGSEGSHENERLLSWTHLVVVHQNATNDQIIAFLWALMRRSTRHSHFQSKFLLDAQGNPQRAEKMRAALVTDKRLLISSLDGHVLWEYPLCDVVDTQVSLESRDYLLVGVRPIGHSSRNAVAPEWKRVHCGSMSSRDELNSSLKKALQDLRPVENTQTSTIEENRPGKKMSLREQELREQPVKVVEMSDLSAATEDLTDGRFVELKSLHQDSSADGRRGVFTNMKLPGRGVQNDKETLFPQFNGQPLDVSQELESLLNSTPTLRDTEAARSLRMFIVNETDEELTFSQCVLKCGRWAVAPPQSVDVNSLVVLEADCSSDRSADIFGSFILSSNDGSKQFVVRFLNALLAANAFAIQYPNGFRGFFKGGEKGEHVMTVLRLEKIDEYVHAETQISETRKNKNTAEPLLFGRSKVSPFLPPINYSPPHAPKESKGDPNDPDLIGKLSSLGFSAKDAREALCKCDADISAAYATLLDERGSFE